MSVRPLITAETIRHARQAGQTAVPVPPGAIVTQQAREDAAQQGIALVAAAQQGIAPVAAAQQGAVPVVAAQQGAVSANAAAPSVNPATAPAQITQLAQTAASASQADQAARLLETGQALLRLAEQLAVKPAAPSAPAHAASSGPVPAQIQAPPAPLPMAEKSCAGACGSGESTLFAQIRKEVLAALPAGIPADMVDELIRKALASQKDGGGCLHCPHREAQAGSAATPWLVEAGGVRRVDSAALNFNLGPAQAGSAGIMQVLGGPDSPQVGYVKLDGGRLDWTFEQAEVVVVLEGDMRFSMNGAAFRAASGDVCAFPAGAAVSFESDGPVRFTTVAM